MTFLFISNDCDEPLYRGQVEIVGCSTKRDAADADRFIGEKGSGKKLASIAALRAGLPSFISSVDDRGPYLLCFAAVTETVGKRSLERICIRCDSPGPDGPVTEVTRTSWSLDAFHDWDRPIGDDVVRLFKPLREHVIDAYDADNSFAWGYCAAPEYAPAGRTAVYLGDHPDFRIVLAHPERYFKFMSGQRPLADLGSGSEIWPKSEEGVTRCFLRGVLVDCCKGRRTSVFDYSVRDKRILSEDRSLTSVDRFDAQVGTMLARLKDEALCERVLRGIDEGEGEIESLAMGYAAPLLGSEAKAAWLRAAHRAFGAKVALSVEAQRTNSDASDVFGYRLITPNRNGFRRFLTAIGIPDADAIAPRASDCSFLPVPFERFDAGSQERFRQAFAIFSALFPDRAAYPNYFYLPLDEKMRAARGFSGYGANRFRSAWLAAVAPTVLPGVSEMVEVLAHETLHCKTGLGDSDAGFALAMQHDVLRLALQLARKDPELRGHEAPVIGALADLEKPATPECIADFRPEELPEGSVFDRTAVEEIVRSFQKP